VIKLCTVEDAPPGRLIHVPAKDGMPEDIVLVNIDGTYFAASHTCSHANAPLSDGQVVDGQIECPKHFSKFDLRTGQPDGLPARKPVRIYPVEVEDGIIFLNPESS
jgi:3-phenylpropionate/trans-cinnamate dioxygenase ferredoxin subunit